MPTSNKAVKQQPAETIGVDLGDKMSRYAILNEGGEVIEEGSSRNTAESIAKHFAKQELSRVAILSVPVLCLGRELCRLFRAEQRRIWNDPGWSIEPPPSNAAQSDQTKAEKQHA